MSRVNLKTVFLIVTILIYLIVTSIVIVPYYRNFLFYWNIIFWSILLIIQLVILRLNNRKNRITYDTLQIILIAVIFYFIVYYMSGIFLGFVNNPLSLKLTNILKNTLIYGTIIISEEYTRTNMIKNIKKTRFNLFVILACFTVITILPSINNITFSSNIEVFKFISTLLIPEIAKNVLLTYIAFKVGYKSSVLYRILMELYVYLLPIFPNAGIYIDSLIGLLFPFIIMFILSGIYAQADSRTRRRITKGGSKIFYLVSVSITLALIFLVSGVFKYQLLAVVSNSMYPVFERGSSVLIEKLDPKDVVNIKKGDILVYKLDNSYILHRVILIEEKDDKLLFTTKGDNNDVSDNKKVTTEQVVGRVLYDIPYIGYPSVWLQEALE